MDGHQGWNFRSFLFSQTGLVFLGLLALAGYFLWTEYQAHVIAALPWLLVGGCLLMHLFMHRGHDDHSGGQGSHHDRHRDHEGS